MKVPLRSVAAKLRDKFFAAWPVIAFFCFLFYTMLFLFGIKQMLLVSVVTVSFRLNYRRQVTARSLIDLVASQLLMAGLAFAATLNVPMCVLLNIAVPCALVMMKVTQFSPTGYFGGAVCFTFLQLRPVGWSGLGTQITALSYGLTVLTAALILHARLGTRTQEGCPERESLALLARAFRVMEGERLDQSLTREMYDLQQRCYQEAGQRRGPARRGQRELMAMLLQRSIYFLGDRVDGVPLSDGERALAGGVAELLEAAGTEGFSTGLTPRAEALLERAACEDSAFCLFAQNFLQLFLSMVISRSGSRPGRGFPPLPSPRRIGMDRFETRFALRLSMVLTVGFVYNVWFHTNHSYWFALNAFLLLRPMYEDSARRLKTRFIGTAAGCVAIPALLTLFHGTAGHIALANLLAVGLYMETPGTWTQAFFSTSFALSLATLSLPEGTAIGLRLIYVTAAVLFVLILNRFFFPVSAKSQFQSNLDRVFHMQHIYLRMAESSLDERLDYSGICRIQMEYHLVHNQLLQYLKGNCAERESAFYGEMLSDLWHMACEAEQILLLINDGQAGAVNRVQLEDYLRFVSQVVNEVQHMLHLKTERQSAGYRVPAYSREMAGAPHLSEAMGRYAAQVSRLYLDVCMHNKTA